MEDEQVQYVNDPRIPCQYGRKCYQKNPIHHNKYKHPPDPKRKKIHRNNDNSKRKKPNTIKEEISEDSTSISDLERVGISPMNNFKNHVDEEEQRRIVGLNVNNDVSDSNSDNESLKIEDSSSNEETTGQSSYSKKNEQTLENVDKNDKSPLCIHSSGHSIEYAKKAIKEKFLFEMPDDFYQFYKFCERMNPKAPSDALSVIGLKLVGPYDLFNSKFCGIIKKDEEYLIHWRYYYDSPQMQTVLKGDDRKGYHIGYFRDFPEEQPVFMVENNGTENGILTPIGSNIFAAVSLFLEEKLKTANPFNKMQVTKIAGELKREAEKLGLDLSRKTNKMAQRNNKVLTRTFNKIGLIVPYERKTQLGYRKLAMSDKDLETLLNKIQKASAEQKPKLLGELQAEILTWTDIASDECDFGTGIELGWNIICHGVEDLNHTASRLLASNYRQLNWDVYAKIAQAHMANRKKGCNLSIF